MTKTSVNFPEQESRIINIVKGVQGLKSKEEAIVFIVAEYGRENLEFEVRPEYLEKLKEIQKGKYHRYNSVEEMKAEIEKEANAGND